MTYETVDFGDEGLNNQYASLISEIDQKLEAFNGAVESFEGEGAKLLRGFAFFFNPRDSKDDQPVNFFGVSGRAIQGPGEASETVIPLVGWECDKQTGNRCYYYYSGGRLRKCCCYPDSQCPT